MFSTSMLRGAVRRLRYPAIAIALVLSSGCGSVQVEQYSDNRPEFAPEEFFNGALTAHGIVKDWQGQAIRYFNADILACWNGGVGTLDEDFIFDDGEAQKRVWTLTPNGNQGYTATAGDVVGSGQARWAGNALFLDYVLRVELEDGAIDLRIDDRMYRVSENVVINQSSMEKFGFGVGDILLTIIRQPNTEGLCATD